MHTHLSPPIHHQILSIQPPLISRIHPFLIEFLAFIFFIRSWCIISCFCSILHSSIKVSFLKCRSDHITIFIFLKCLHCLCKLIPAHLTSHPCSSPIPYFSSHPYQFSVPICHLFSLWMPLHLHSLCEDCALLPSRCADYSTFRHGVHIAMSLSLLYPFSWPPHKDLCAPSSWALDFLCFLDRKYLEGRDFILLFISTAPSKFAKWISK